MDRVGLSRRDFGRIAGGLAGALCLPAPAFSQAPAPSIPYRNPVVGSRIFVEVASDDQGVMEMGWETVTGVRGMVVNWESPYEETATYGHFKEYDRDFDGRDGQMERLWPLTIGTDVSFRQGTADFRFLVVGRQSLTLRFGEVDAVHVRVWGGPTSRTDGSSLFWDPVSAVVVRRADSEFDFTVQDIRRG